MWRVVRSSPGTRNANGGAGWGGGVDELSLGYFCETFRLKYPLAVEQMDLGEGRRKRERGEERQRESEREGGKEEEKKRKERKEGRKKEKLRSSYITHVY